ncbi:MAG: hypothetical protein C0514_00370 [Candidatus Puniceispirillum sp.]|nr:hypothetical protein [Candidatus Puniceispirillum sp.]
MRHFLAKFFSCFLWSVFFAHVVLASSQAEELLDITRPTCVHDLAFLDETGRKESYEDTFHETQAMFGEKDTLFGVYLLKVNAVPVAAHALCAHNHNGYLVAEGMTDVLESHQGRRYGTILRMEAAKLAQSAIESKRIFMMNECPMTLDYLYSTNEWLWGENHPSLKSSLNAGYGVACVSSHLGLAHLLYPKNEAMWADERVNHLMDASALIYKAHQKGRSLTHDVRSHEQIPFDQSVEIIDHFRCIINDLNLDKDHDVISLLSLLSFLLTKGEGLGARRVVEEYCSALDDARAHQMVRLLCEQDGPEPRFPGKLTRYFSVRMPNALNCPGLLPLLERESKA